MAVGSNIRIRDEGEEEKKRVACFYSCYRRGCRRDDGWRQLLWTLEERWLWGMLMTQACNGVFVVYRAQ